MKNASQIKAILIDPFQLEIYPIRVDRNDRLSLGLLLDCEFVQMTSLNVMAHGVAHVAWVDEEGLLRQPFVYPYWVMESANGGHPLAGYGIITGLDDQGAMLDCAIPLERLAHALMFEPWRTRIAIDNVIPQMMRVYKLAS